MKLEFSRQIFEKYWITKFHESPSSGSRVVPFGRTHGQLCRHDEANSPFSKFGKRTWYHGVNLVDDTASLRGAFFRWNTGCWVAVLVPHWVWQTFAVNTFIRTVVSRLHVEATERYLTDDRNDGCLSCPVFCYCHCIPDPLACSYNTNLLSRDYHYKQSCEPNVGTTGRASVNSSKQTFGGGPVGPLSLAGLCSCSVLLRRISNLMKNNSNSRHGACRGGEIHPFLVRM
jgi:hypothetical protein